MVHTFKLAKGIAAVGLVLSAVAGCDIDQTREARLPDVDVDVEPGQMPAYDIETADVEVSMEEKTVKVPDVDVSMEETTISVPDVDVEMPDDQDGGNT